MAIFSKIVKKIKSKHYSNIEYAISNDFIISMLIYFTEKSEDHLTYLDSFTDEVHELYIMFDDKLDFYTENAYKISTVIKLLHQNFDIDNNIITNINDNDKYKLVKQEIIDVIKNELDNMNKKIEEIKLQSSIEFRNIPLLYRNGMSIIMKSEHGYDYCGIVESTALHTTMFGQYYRIKYHYCVINENKISSITDNCYVYEFEGLMPISQILEIPNAEQIEFYKNRGKQIKRFTEKSEYLYCNSNMFIKYWFGYRKIYSEGRMIIDEILFSKYNPNYDYGEINNTYAINKNEKAFPDNQLYILYPLVKGYSMRLKAWGEFEISSLSPIKYNENAFDLLELNKDRKEIIKNIVSGSDCNTFQDLITGKGNGIIFLLYGPPGVGKTLTAEAISELLKRPLYIVNIGELGTNAVDLEDGLQRALELATKWNAILLIDEADIFLEKRTSDNIERNAMVGIFLRLLEYYNGILFLTTNRIDVLDDAFESRISLILEYAGLTGNMRFNIWKTLLTNQNINIDDSLLHELAKLNINGRQIKNLIKMTMINCRVTKKPVTYVEIMKLHKITIYKN